jgi:hypothetical protein
MRRIILVMVVAAVTLVGSATPVMAHGAGGSDASNYASTVTGIAAVNAQGNPTGRVTLPPGVTWRVLANDALLQVQNRSGTELVVLGYRDEPYLRVGPDGVWQNRNSPATYQNTDRYARVQVPAGASADAKPEWVRVADQPVYAWHDHRVHWMSGTLPPQVIASQGAETVVFDWTVPFALGDERLAVTGTLRWVPPPPWWPWILGASAVTALPLLLALRRPPAGDQRRALVVSGALVLAAVVLITVVHSVDDVLAVPATPAQHLVASAQSVLFIGMGAFGAYKGWRGKNGAGEAVIFGSVALAVGIGLTHLPTLASSQVATTLPVWFSRAVVAANLALVVLAGSVLWRGREPLPEPQEPWESWESADAPAAQPSGDAR